MSQSRHSFDNGLVCGGNETIEIDGIIFGPTLARAYIEPGETSANARVCCQLFVAEIDPSAVKAEDIDACLWADVDGLGSYVEMRLVADRWVVPVLHGDNLVFESAAFPLSGTGAFNYTLVFSADSHVEAKRKEWISLNDLAKNCVGVIVVSLQWLRQGPTIAEVCMRKVGAEIS